MKVLVTGGAGMIGSLLTRSLLSREDVELVTVIDSLEHKCNVFWDICDDPRFKFIRVDILSSDDLMSDLYAEHDVIIPAAGPVGYPKCEFYKVNTWAVNTTAIVWMLSEIKGSGKRVIYLNSNSGYGTRPDGGEITEDMDLSPISNYGRSKVATEKVVLEENHVSLRLGTVAGVSPCMRLDLLVNDFTFKSVKDNVITVFQGNASRNIVHIQDVCNAVLFAIDNFGLMKRQAFNVGEINITKFDLAKKISEHTGCHVIEAEFAEDKDKRDYRINCDRLRNLGFKFKWNLDSTIKQLVKFYSTVSLSSHNLRYENNEFMSLV
jgi:nucleoside-diphosphate-sugar epimerase